MAEDFPLDVMSLPQWLQHALKILPDLHQEPMLMLKLSKSHHQQMTNNPSTNSFIIDNKVGNNHNPDKLSTKY